MQPRRKRPGPLSIALAISIVLHLAGLPLLRAFPAARAAAQETPPPFSVTATIHTPVPTPPPTPTPPPIVHRAAPAHPATPHRVAFTPPHATSHSAHGSVEPVGPRTPSTDAPIPDATGEPGTPAPVETAQPVVPTAAPPACTQPDRDARVVNPVTPDRPAAAAELGAFGTVDVRVTLAADGSVVSTAIEHSSGFASLDAAAKDAAARARYAPALSKCAAAGGTYLYRVDFTE